MIIDFLENPQKKIINIFFHENQKLSKNYIGSNSSYLKFGKKTNLLNKNIIFSFDNLNQLKKFNKKFKFSKTKKFSIYYTYISSKSKKIDKFFFLISLIFIKKKEIIFINENYQNSFIPDFLYNINFKSQLKSLIYFFYQFLRNFYSIFKSNIILIKAS